MADPTASGWFRAVAPGLVFGLVSAAAPAALAQPGLRLQISPMVVHEAREGYAGGLGSSGFVLLGPLELGAGVSGETQLLGYHRLGLAAHAGLRARLGRAELDAAATAGVAWLHTGHGLLSDDPGAGGGIAFVGGRVGYEHALFVSRERGTRAGLGLAVAYEQDLAPYDVTYRYQETPWLDFDGNAQPYTEERTVRIGMQRVAVMLVAAVGFR